ncbi:hypothetical protein BAUCODRAFT_28502 [Baudoinia panamericana UAMH 10762]|uniref:Prenyltransferase alpha-alpha toroid domain-containing protein n=1 Tax=Baudoinia panamericana (strain UAMH 10762) TaxID=717646 RepID=M2LBW9_BAUPA|nr:uncharacterized protein BAUCODRAFT_28502 [Baudoinia panamericana UAMH 10762]EMC91392.1 hypothetical protein BAUCODRAFT_28502 [Baudoinia panamericana UAMH 10762]
MAVLSNEDAAQEPDLDKARHVKYWTRCLKTLLPHHYTSNDSNRLYLAYFIVSALDLLGALDTVSSADEREDYVNWIYRCQHPNGGFRMFPGTDFGERATAENACWDPANIPATYFALASLLILKDDFSRINRAGTLHWLRQMQREDGSFGETLVNGRIEGGRDPRCGYCAAGIRYILRGLREGSAKVNGQEVDDINVNQLVHCVRLAETFSGGLADEPFHEPHAGYTFCCLGALALLGRLNLTGPPAESPLEAPKNPEEVLKWLVFLQTELSDPNAGVDSEFAQSQRRSNKPANSKKIDEARDARKDTVHQEPCETVGVTLFDLIVDGAGMCGRPNKVADTCYAFWAGACFHIMQQPQLYNDQAIRRYLLGKTQHDVLGGFGKFAGDLPDLYHSYLGLAALSLAEMTGVKKLDAGMCMSTEARSRLPKLWASWNV